MRSPPLSWALTKTLPSARAGPGCPDGTGSYRVSEPSSGNEVLRAAPPLSHGRPVGLRPSGSRGTSLVTETAMKATSSRPDLRPHADPHFFSQHLVHSGPCVLEGICAHLSATFKYKFILQFR